MSSVMFHSAIVKIAGRCNINCSYCYMYHSVDQSWTGQPVFMSPEVIRAFFERLSEYLIETRIEEFHLSLHGGEPLMAGRSILRLFADERRAVEHKTGAILTVSLQSNGLLLDDEWIEFLSCERIRLGVSLDGPARYHDEFRRTKRGHGTHLQTEAIVRRLSTDPQWRKCFSGTLCVLNHRADGGELVRYFYKLGVPRINLLLPDQNHDYPVHSKEERRQLGRVLREAYIEWRRLDDPAFTILFFEDLGRFFLTGELPRGDMLAGNPITILTIETSGAIEPLDVFKCCGRNYTKTDYSVFGTPFILLTTRDPFVRQLYPLDTIPGNCKACQFVRICGGGYLPHRLFEGQFNRESVFCPELLELFALIQSDLSRVERRVLDAVE